MRGVGKRCSLKVFVVVQTIISGGQTGVDRAALDVAIALHIPHAGWCPQGRLAEDGCIDLRYNLSETNERDYSVRTELNVVESNATLIFFRTKLTGGTRLTGSLAKKHSRPQLKIDLDEPVDDSVFREWQIGHSIERLNIAGPRESSQPGIYQTTFEILKIWLAPFSGTENLA